jgi:hypothetical protein
MSDQDVLSLDKTVAQHAAVAGNRITLYNDARGPSGGGAFSDMPAFIGNARHFVFIAD